MAPTPQDDTPTTLRAAVDRMVALRAEHKPILDMIAGDAGMAPETRRTLLDHLRQEEDEKLDTIARLTSAEGAGGAKPHRGHSEAAVKPSHETPTASGPATVGSLRRATASPRDAVAHPSKSVGSLRNP
jgi:hypothetical protein